MGAPAKAAVLELIDAYMEGTPGRPSRCSSWADVWAGTERLLKSQLLQRMF